MSNAAQRLAVGLFGGLVLLSTATRCATHAPPKTHFAPPAQVERSPARRFEEVGKASWYGPKLHGRKTASGERFNTNALTAAHRSLPLGTTAVVTNLETGRSVRVRINDRGPYVKGRKIDLSRAAARRIGLTTKKGVARVKIQVTRPGRHPTPAASRR